MREELEDLLITIFCDVDDFCKGYEKYYSETLQIDSSNKELTTQKTSMSMSEIITITIYFHLSGYRCFK